IPPCALFSYTRSSDLFFFRLHHFYAHHMNLALIGVNVSADAHMMANMVLQRLRVHHVPALLVGVIYECDFVTVLLYGALQRLQRRRSCHLALAAVATLAHVLCNCGHATDDANSHYKDPKLLHIAQSP